jgi:hypothetical protein
MIADECAAVDGMRIAGDIEVLENHHKSHMT